MRLAKEKILEENFWRKSGKVSWARAPGKFRGVHAQKFKWPSLGGVSDNLMREPAKILALPHLIVRIMVFLPFFLIMQRYLSVAMIFFWFLSISVPELYIFGDELLFWFNVFFLHFDGLYCIHGDQISCPFHLTAVGIIGNNVFLLDSFLSYNCAADKIGTAVQAI